MALTYEPIATTTAAGGSSTITFSSIPGTYTDLRLVLNLQCSTNNDTLMRFNSDTATNYSYVGLRGNGSSAASTGYTTRSSIFLNPNSANAVSPYWDFHIVDIFSYSGNTNKTALLSEFSDFNGSGLVQVQVSLWRSTSAITSITISTGAGSWNSGSTATIYGIKAA